MCVLTVTEVLILIAELHVANLDSYSLQRSTIRETIWGRLRWAAGAPILNRPKEVNVVTVAVVKSKVAVITGRLGSVPVELMLDSGSSISLVQHDVLSQAQDIVWVKAT